jgi:ferritin
MLKNKILENLNQQIEKEAYSSHLYLSMASWAETKGLEGTAAWLYEHADEERQHMLKFIAYVNERGGKSHIPALKEPPKEFTSVKALFEDILEHERYITDSINSIVEVCLQEKDFTTHNWLQWFVTEQIEEEALVNGILDKLNLLGDSNMYMFDRDLKDSIGTTQQEA